MALSKAFKALNTVDKAHGTAFKAPRTARRTLSTAFTALSTAVREPITNLESFGYSLPGCTQPQPSRLADSSVG